MRSQSLRTGGPPDRWAPPKSPGDTTIIDTTSRHHEAEGYFDPSGADRRQHIRRVVG